MRGGGGGDCRILANVNSRAHHVTWSPNDKIWRSNSIFNLYAPTSPCRWYYWSRVSTALTYAAWATAAVAAEDSSARSPKNDVIQSSCWQYIYFLSIFIVGVTPPWEGRHWCTDDLSISSSLKLTEKFPQAMWLINYIETKAKCCHLKNWPVKGLCARCLSEYTCSM
jgi:hypothetical protein